MSLGLSFGLTEAQISGFAIICKEKWLGFGLSFGSSEAQISEFAIVCNEKWLSFGLSFGASDKATAQTFNKSYISQ